MSMNAAVHTHEIEHPKDILGIRIVVGNTIAMAFPEGNSAVVRIGKVLEIKMINKMYESFLDYMLIEWENVPWLEKSKVRKIRGRILVLN